MSQSTVAPRNQGPHGHEDAAARELVGLFTTHGAEPPGVTHGCAYLVVATIMLAASVIFITEIVMPVANFCANLWSMYKLTTMAVFTVATGARTGLLGRSFRFINALVRVLATQ